MGQSAALYARASTADQSCQRQIADLTAFANRCGYEIAGTFAETVSGAASRRPERDRIMRLARQRRIDAVLVTEVSRWGRSTQDLLATLHQLAGWNVSAVARNGLALELDTPHGRMMATVLAGIAQFEREPISERVKSGLAAARERGVKLGRQPGQRPKADRLAPKVLRAVDEGRGHRWIALDPVISENTVPAIVRRGRGLRFLAKASSPAVWWMAVSGSAPGAKSRSALDRCRKRCGTFSRGPRATATAIRHSPKLWTGRSGRRGKTTATAWGVRPWTAEMGVPEQTRSFRTTDAIRRWTDIEVTAIERACHRLDRRMAERGEDRDAISRTVAGMRREWRGGALLRALAERGIAGVQGSPEADAVPYPGNLTAFVPPR
ncbi:MAG: recombinase family protein, partial [Rhodobacter sp.]|nr:recombinase family protein [Rhodobacter sp.]